MPEYAPGGQSVKWPSRAARGVVRGMPLLLPPLPLDPGFGRRGPGALTPALPLPTAPDSCPCQLPLITAAALLAIPMAEIAPILSRIATA